MCFEGNGDSAAEPSEMDPDSGHCSRTSVRGDDVVCFKKDHVELGRSFQMAVSVHDWTLAESLVPLADPQRLNDGLVFLKVQEVARFSNEILLCSCVSVRSFDLGFSLS